MTKPAPTEPGPMLIVDCPLCDRPAVLDADAGVLACDACEVCVELAPDEPAGLPLAA